MSTFIIILLVTVATVIMVSHLFGAAYEYLHYRCISLKKGNTGNPRKADIASTLQGLSFLALILADIIALVATFCACKLITQSVLGWIAVSLLVYAGIFIIGLNIRLKSIKQYKRKYNTDIR